MLQIQHLTKEYPGGKVAVQNLSLTVNAGDLFGFIGHNGAGKTTTIKAVAGILPFEDGEIFIDGLSVREQPMDCKRKIAYVPDSPDLYEYLTGMQYLNFLGDIFRVPKKQRQERVEVYASRLTIQNDLNSPIASYSHGMKQKLSLVAAFLHAPKLLILDEPFVGLDPSAAYEVKNMMKEFCREGNAIFFSTHVLEVAEKLCNKVAIIKQGRLIADGSMEKIKGDSSLEQVFLELVDHHA